MPIYDYKCNDCSETFSKIYVRREELEHEYDDLKCPTCDSTQITKVMSVVSGFDLKGSGFYKNDYGRKNNNRDD